MHTSDKDAFWYKNAIIYELHVGSEPYFLTLSPDAAFWFSLEPSVARRYELAASAGPQVRTVQVASDWKEILHPRERQKLEVILPDYLKGRRWFGGKGRELKGVRMRDDRLAVGVRTGVHHHHCGRLCRKRIGGISVAENKEQNDVLRHTHLLEKAVYELGYELNNPPDWVKIPLQGLVHL